MSRNNHSAPLPDHGYASWWMWKPLGGLEMTIYTAYRQGLNWFPILFMYCGPSADLLTIEDGELRSEIFDEE